jgi:hypothetical protein
MVIAGFQSVTAVLIYRLVKNNLSHAVAILAASFWAFNFYIHSVVYEMGLETPLAAFAVTWLIYKFSRFEQEWRTQEVVFKRNSQGWGSLRYLSCSAALTLFFLRSSQAYG